VKKKAAKTPEYQQFANVWDALCDTPEEAANLTARSELMMQITRIVKKSGWTQAEAAKRCRVTQPRMNDLLRGRIDRFSLDALVNIATTLGRKVQLKLKAA
jgi:predicted XRE-type DNA-binding protein